MVFHELYKYYASGRVLCVCVELVHRAIFISLCAVQCLFLILSHFIQLSFYTTELLFFRSFHFWYFGVQQKSTVSLSTSSSLVLRLPSSYASLSREQFSCVFLVAFFIQPQCGRSLCLGSIHCIALQFSHSICAFFWFSHAVSLSLSLYPPRSFSFCFSFYLPPFTFFPRLISIVLSLFPQFHLM